MYRLGVPAVRALPEKLVYWLALRGADRFYATDHHGRLAVKKNLRQIFAAQGRRPAKDVVDGTARKTYQYFGKNLIDFFRFARITEEQLEGRFSLQGIDRLQDVHAEGKGVIIVTAHFGNYELGGAVLSSLGYRVSAVVLPQRLAALDHLFDSQREKHGLHVIPLGSSAFGLVHCLRRGELVALLGDRDFTEHGINVEFFGRPARMPVGPAWLASKTGAAIVPCFVSRMVDDSFLFHAHAPIRVEKGTPVEQTQKLICAAMEEEIAEQPYQWCIFEDFWQSAEEKDGAAE